MTPHIGIDFGTTKTLVSHINPQTGTPELIRLGRGSDILPTTAYVHHNGHCDFGDDADDQIEYNEGTYIRGFKMELGSPTPLHMYFTEGKMQRITAKDLVRQFLQYVREYVQHEVYLGEEVNEATITRPVNFTPAQCAELEEAAREAGFTRVEFTTEPEAAGLAFCQLNAAQAFRKSALIVDWGGGTLDLALVSRENGRITIHRNMTSGDMEIGGEKFDEYLWYYVSDSLRAQGMHNLNRVTQLPKIRKAKEQLSKKESVNLRLSYDGGVCPPLLLSQNLFNQLIHESIDKSCELVQALLQRIPAEDKPEMLLLVGGSCGIPLIKEKLEKACGLPAHNWHYSREAVAMGAALWIKEEAPANPPQEDEVALGEQEQQYDEANEEETDAPLPVQAAELEQTAASDTAPGDYMESDEYEEAIPHLLQEEEQGDVVEQALQNEQQQRMMQACPQPPQPPRNVWEQSAPQYHIAAQQGLNPAQALQNEPQQHTMQAYPQPPQPPRNVWEQSAPQYHIAAHQGLDPAQALQNEPQQHTMQAYPQSPQGAENTQQTQQTGNTRLVSGSTYFLLAIFLGHLGVHNFYAKRHIVAIIQLCFSLGSGFTLSFLPWIWAIVETFIVNKDGENIPFEDAEKSIPTQIKKKVKDTIGRK